MHFAIDVDQTVCGSNAHQIYAAFHNTDLHLDIDPLILEGITSYREFLQLPQVIALRQVDERAWNASRHRAISTPEVLLAFSPIHGAAQGVSILSHAGTLAYYTARTLTVSQTTQCWLEHHAFPCSWAVTCSEQIEQKLRILANHEPRHEPIVLIDDRGHTHVLTMLERLQGETAIQALLQRLTIIAFGTSTLPETTMCPLIALPSWDQLQSTMASLAL